MKRFNNKIRQLFCKHVYKTKIIMDKELGLISLKYCVKCNKVEIKYVFNKLNKRFNKK